MIKRTTSSIFVLLFLLPSLNSAAFNDETILKIDRDYGSIHAVAVPHEIQITYPFLVSKVVYPEQIPEEGALVKFQFIEGNNLSENLIIKYLKIPLYETDKRFTFAKKTLLETLNQYPQASIISIKNIKIINYDAVAVHAQNGGFFLSLYAIINPSSQHSILAVINSDPRYSAINSISTLDNDKRGLAREVLHTLKFGKEYM